MKIIERFCTCAVILKLIFSTQFQSCILSLLQICRVEDLIVSGVVKGSVVHIHRARTVTIDTDGMISASELGDSVFQFLLYCGYDLV